MGIYTFENRGAFAESLVERKTRELEKEMAAIRKEKKLNALMGGFSIEKKESKEKPVATFRLDMARHSKKEGGADVGQGVDLTPEGMELAAKKGVENDEGTKATFEKVKEKLESGEVIEAHGSPRIRTYETTAARLLAEQLKNANFKGVDPKEFVKWLEEGGHFQRKVSNLLNFLSGSGEFEKMENAKYKENVLMEWFVEGSDNFAIETKQNPKETTTLSIHAGNVAQFIKELALSKIRGMALGSKKEDFAFATSHQSVLESFLYKVIKKVDGEEAAKVFIDNKKAGFDFNEGFKIDFDFYGKSKNDWIVNLSFNGKEYKVEPEILNKIIIEGLNQQEDMERSMKGLPVLKREWRDKIEEPILEQKVEEQKKAA